MRMRRTSDETAAHFKEILRTRLRGNSRMKLPSSFRAKMVQRKPEAGIQILLYVDEDGEEDGMRRDTLFMNICAPFRTKSHLVPPPF